MDKHLFRYACLPICVYGLIYILGFDQQTQADIMLLFPVRLLPCAMTFALSAMVILFYIRTVLECILVDTQVRIRIGAGFDRWIFQRCAVACVVMVLIGCIAGLIMRFTAFEMMQLVFLHIGCLLLFMISVKMLEKKRFSYIFLVNVFMHMVVRLLFMQI